jgi:hypothetical protein
MLQLGDKGARESKKNFSRAQALALSDGPAFKTVVSNDRRPVGALREHNFDAQTRPEAHFSRFERLTPPAGPTIVAPSLQVDR